MRARGLGVSVASVVGSFVVYGAHVACGVGPRGVPSAPAQSPTQPTTQPTSPSATAAPASTADAAAGATSAACGCAAPRATAWMAFAGDEKIALDPVDAESSLEVAYGRGPGGKRRVVLTAVVRAYRTDVPAERPTTFSIRVVLPDTTPPSALTAGATTATIAAAAPTAGPLGPAVTPASKDVEAYLSTWSSGGAVAPRVYATVTKTSLTATVSDALVEIRGALTLKDVPTGRTVTIDKLSLRKVGTSLLPDRTGALRAP